ncbi:hypothetical protein CYMTET_40604 [Cymbomonas tetramitiformis]|uniref:Protein CLP1 homolog n=1 Tax=Cymbomonas tetramitiformis TaxID=36881 RepID=A0AAE0C7U1_9CHLO|nr:hypothetical protein CYMTET_40605 [Cymbomonas tetramitiformis]KAK3249996.1 hypothetical protein CYMTET_40604 [Cymbomonas tetramitiformis]
MSCIRKFMLCKEHELRVEVEFKDNVTVKLTGGTAEIFGTEIAVDQQLLTFSGTKFAIFTWQGAELELSGSSFNAYIADETPMVNYINTHSILHSRRVAAQEAEVSGQGPITMVVGPTDSGKSSLCKLLVNYAVRQGQKPLLVDLDLGQGMITLPGTVGATAVQRPIDPVQESLLLEAPLIYFFGQTSPKENPELYRHYVEHMAEILRRRNANYAVGRAAGLVINSMGWVDGLGYELLLHSARALRATVLIVLEDRLHSELEKEFSGTDVEVLKMPKSGGVVMRTVDFRKMTRSSKISEYFYGVDGKLNITTWVKKFSEVSVYKIGCGPRAPSSALPLGAKPTANPLRVAPVEWTRELQNSVLAITYAISPDDLLTSNVAGFIWVTEVDVQRGQVTYQAPCQGELPTTIFLAGDLKFYE